jgi:2,4-dienoyl-CoA reductase-like NADH-dependent reductase (Old Yellow Enzyme family)/thioredoxin reductase
MDKYEHVFTPFSFGGVTVKNRIATPPMLACMASPDGFVTGELIEFYKVFAKGGAGIVTVGDAATDFKYGRGHNSQLNLGDDGVTIGLYRLVESIQRYGATASIEVNHRGRWTFPHMLGGKNPIGPSPITAPTEEFNARREGRKPAQVTEMDQQMIDMVIEDFVSAVGRCILAGFKMVMIHGGHGHLLAQFASAFANKRTDSYGGSLQNRARFPLEVLTSVRDKFGDKLAIEYRISGDEMVVGGMHIDETIEFLRLIRDKIDLVNVSLGITNDIFVAPHHLQPTYLPRNYTVYYAERIRNEVGIPVTCVGSVSSLAAADKIIGDGAADIVAMGRRHIADPDLVRKTWAGFEDRIRPCLRCGTCSENPRVDLPVFCAVNPVTGKEIEYGDIPPARERKKALIVGGGPGGMEAARRAAERGHAVTLVEKEDRLGGALIAASAASFKEDMREYLEWSVRETQRLPIDIRLNMEATPDLVRAEAPDVLIIAAGAEPLLPDVPGVAGDNVVLATDVHLGKATTGAVVVVVGGGLTGCEVALDLARKGKQVTVIDMVGEDEIASDAKAMNRFTLLDLLAEEKVRIIPEVKLEEIRADGVLVMDKRWNQLEIPAVTVVLAVGSAARSGTVAALSGIVRDTYVIGDCRESRNLKEAIHEAFNVVVGMI